MASVKRIAAPSVRRGEIPDAIELELADGTIVPYAINRRELNRRRRTLQKTLRERERDRRTASTARLALRGLK